MENFLIKISFLMVISLITNFVGNQELIDDDINFIV